MNTLSYKTKSATPSTIHKEWLVVDATDKILGRMVSEVAQLLKGKHKPNYTPHMDCGDNIIIINADKIKLTGKKWESRISYTYSGFPGGQKALTPAKIFEKDPAKLVEKAVRGMLPKTRLGRQQFRNLYVYAGSEHKHEAQQPRIIELNIDK